MLLTYPLNLLTRFLLSNSTAMQHNYFSQRLPLETDKDSFIDCAMQEGLGPLLYNVLLKTDRLDWFDKEQQQRLRIMYYRSLCSNLRITHECKNIIETSHRRHLKIVLLQGISFLYSVYDDIGQRPLSDIDLWILKSDYPVIKDILISRGYTTEYMYPLNFKNKDISIDLHLHILWADRIRARKGLLQTDQQVLFDRAVQIQFEGQRAYVLDPLDQVIYLGLHLLKHNAERLIWLVDIQRLVEGWDDTRWKALVHRADQLGQTKCLLYVCFLLQRLLNMRFTGEISGRFKQLSVVEKKILRYRESKGSLPQWSTLLFFPAGKGLAKSLPFVFETLFPKADILRQVFPDSAGLNASQLYTRRARQLISMLKSH